LELHPHVELEYGNEALNAEMTRDEMSDSESETPDDDIDKEEMRTLLAELKNEHRRIDKEIEALEQTGVIDVLKIRRMKKIKLSIKDQIVFIENQLTPDIIA